MRFRAALVLALMALALPACGGDSEPSSDTDVNPPDLTIPSTDTSGGDDEPGLGEATDTDGTEGDDTGGEDTTGDDGSAGDGTAEDPSTAQQAPGEGDGNSADDTPDSATNDTPPQPGSAAERFEQYCEENPGAC